MFYLFIIIAFFSQCVVNNVDAFINKRNITFDKIISQVVITYNNGGWQGHSTRKSKTYGFSKLFRWLIDLYPVVASSVGDDFSGQVKV